MYLLLIFHLKLNIYLQGVTLGDGAVQDPQELGTDTGRNTGVPRRIKPEYSPLSPPFFSPTPFVVVVELVDVYLLVYKPQEHLDTFVCIH